MNVTATTITTSTTTIALQDIWNTTSDVVSRYLFIILNYIELIPGGSILVRYIKSSHKNDPIRTLFEIALFIFAIRYFTTAKYERSKKDHIKLKNSEIDELIDDWMPEPLVLDISPKEQWQLNSIPIVKGPIDTKVNLVGEEGDFLNFASSNFLNFGINPIVKNECKKIIHSNGVGACGPPNFYGNQDIHIKLENDLAKFFEVGGAVLYGQDFCTAGSVLPSFLKRGDFVIADASSNVAIQKALQLSRCEIYWFNHNDLDHLEEILIDLQKNIFKFEKPISRKFIVTEGIFANKGDSPYLPRLIELKKKFKFRLFLDESLSLGVLGKSGKGLAEHYNIKRSEIDVTISSMANSFSSSGAFCIGDKVMTYHQRIGSMAYCFSASLPAYVARATSVALRLLTDSQDSQGESSIVKKLQSNNYQLFNLFNKDRKLSKYLKIISNEISPILHFEINSDLRKLLNFPISYTGKGSEIEYKNKKGISDKFVESFNYENLIFQKIINLSKKQGILITRSIFTIEQEALPLIPNLKIHSNVDFTKDEIEKVYKIVSKVILDVFENLTVESLSLLTEEVI
ncbi:serine palmitoyltransferase [Wickerhamomyces ciferrii]|uniref:serine C-palmitoyltransferase n=2 Tax=Wickerhamomyces ciferrii TaxID=1041607 RepID=K0K6W0_WICCF|nr:serine palmitoyltransferase [Wickerhamomyces ciferrii]AEX09418.1 serine palmitoyltransferase subunit [Wickerhamomyces ciferrii]CCH40635.1 serine palmitoyltransferase [Wickerhamomyces ciferrii]